MTTTSHDDAGPGRWRVSSAPAGATLSMHPLHLAASTRGRLARLVAALASLVALALVGCAHTPAPPEQAALYLDARRIVETRERAGWFIDASEVEEATPLMLRSVCRVDARTRAQTLAWVEAQVEAGGGSAREVYAASGRDLDAIDELLTLERVHALLSAAGARADAECPFWVEPEPDFRGVQGSGERFIVVLESRGQGSLYLGLDDSLAFGGGGGGRLLPAWGVSDTFLIALGLDVGGQGIFSQDDARQGEEEAQQLDATVSLATPLLMRFHGTTAVYDVEVAATTFFAPGEPAFTPGVRVAFGLGLSAVRLGAFLPVGVLQLGYEYHPARGEFPALHVLLAGTRVGFEADFF